MNKCIILYISDKKAGMKIEMLTKCLSNFKMRTIFLLALVVIALICVQNVDCHRHGDSHDNNDELSGNEHHHHHHQDDGYIKQASDAIHHAGHGIAEGVRTVTHGIAEGARSVTHEIVEEVFELGSGIREAAEVITSLGGRDSDDINEYDNNDDDNNDDDKNIDNYTEHSGHKTESDEHESPKDSHKAEHSGHKTEGDEHKSPKDSHKAEHSGHKTESDEHKSPKDSHKAEHKSPKDGVRRVGSEIGEGIYHIEDGIEHVESEIKHDECHKRHDSDECHKRHDSDECHKRRPSIVRRNSTVITHQHCNNVTISQQNISAIATTCFAQVNATINNALLSNGTYNNTAIAVAFFNCGLSAFTKLQGNGTNGLPNFCPDNLEYFFTVYFNDIQGLALRYASNQTYFTDPDFKLKAVLITAYFETIDDSFEQILPGSSVEEFTGSSGSVNVGDPYLLFNFTTTDTVVVVGNRVFLLRPVTVPVGGVLLPPGPCISYDVSFFLSLLSRGGVTAWSSNRTIVDPTNVGQSCQVTAYGPFLDTVSIDFDDLFTNVSFSGVTTQLDTGSSLIFTFATRTNNDQAYATNGDVDPATVTTANSTAIPIQSVSGNNTITIPEGNTLTGAGTGGASLTSTLKLATPEGPVASGTYTQSADSTVPLDAVDRYSYNVFDWRNYAGGKSIVSTVKDQMGCGSCWDFAGTGNFEAATQLAYGLYTVGADTNPGAD
jgi:hypothetical protein